MKRLRERLVIAGILLGLPALYWLAGMRPALKRLEALRQRIQAANEDTKEIARFAPLSSEEHKLLDDPRAPWRQRIPVIAGDRDRVVHYDRVVSNLQSVWRQGGITPLSMRSSWDPIKASFTVPASLSEPAAVTAMGQDSPDLKLKGWVLEAGIAGDTGNLFKAMALTSRAQPLLEPAGLRWIAAPDERDQYLLLRNLFLTP